MTFYEALVPACLKLYSENGIRLDRRMEFGFAYQGSKLAIEDVAREISGNSPRDIDWVKLCEECQKAAAIVREIEESPLGKALK